MFWFVKTPSSLDFHTRGDTSHLSRGNRPLSRTTSHLETPQPPPAGGEGKDESAREGKDEIAREGKDESAREGKDESAREDSVFGLTGARHIRCCCSFIVNEYDERLIV